VSKDNVDELVSCSDPYSEKIVHLVAKYKALDDCMSAVQKGYEKNAIDLPDFLQTIRRLSGKQFKQLHKMEKINEKMVGNSAQFTGY
jgi:tRNA uridine 5-carbamoylmethylation protein Kti12